MNTYFSFKRFNIIFFFLLFASFSYSQVTFKESNLSQAKSKISNSKLPVIIYFSAAWASSCQLMESTTFKDKQVSEQINAKYLIYKVDVGNKGSNKWMEKYAITRFPTTLFYSASEKLQYKLEAPVSSTEFLEILENSSTKRLINKPLIPAEYNNTSNKVDSYKNSTKENNSIRANKESYTSAYEKILVRNKKIISYLKLAQPVQTGNQFIVQIGQYANVRNAERVVQIIQSKYDYPVKIRFGKKDKMPLQMVYIGEFKSKKEAIAANNNLKWINRKGIVKPF